MLVSTTLSLRGLLGSPYIDAVLGARRALGDEDPAEMAALADQPVCFYGQEDRRRQQRLLGLVGKQIAPAFDNQEEGAPTDAFRKASHAAAAPLTGAGCFRVGEDGRVYLLGKSEHYHASLGQAFGGYRLLDNARRLHILNATHNNTRGYITRLLERALIAAANGLAVDDPGLEAVLSTRAPQALNRVINLETGSVAVEAGIKMMLARFYALDGTYTPPKYAGRTPVFFVMADESGAPEANYHGTSVVAQTFRGLWPAYRACAEQAGLYRVVPVAINDLEDFREKLRRYNAGPYKTAGFLHELVLMNYGGVRLEPAYVQAAHALCRETDTPVLVDEIQSCMWYPGMFLFRQYGLTPDFVIIGKGFPGGEYPASKILTTGEMDTLNQFGALVTNGQEELASLSYLVTMRFAADNAAAIAALGARFERGLRVLGEKYSALVTRIEGLGHLGAIHFASVETAAAFAARLNACCIDTSAQLYKPHCPPAVLFKPPLVAEEPVLDFLLERIDAALGAFAGGENR